MRKLGIRLEQSLSLSLENIERLAHVWNERVSDPLAFTPSEIVESGVTPEQAIIANKQFGQFATDYLKQAFKMTTSVDRRRRIEGGKKIVAVGYGCSYDSYWLEDATLAGLETWWIDVSDKACMNAKNSLAQQVSWLAGRGINFFSPKVKWGEIRSILAEPHRIDLDLDSVEVWYLSRLISCLSIRSATIVLMGVGRTLREEVDKNKRNFIVFINALSDYNPEVSTKTSHMYSRKKVLSNIALGAERPVMFCYESSYRFWNKIVTATVIMAK